MLHEVQDVHEQLYAFNNTPHRDAAHWLFFNYGTKCSRRADGKMLKEYPGLSVNLVTGIPAPDLIADGLDGDPRRRVARFQPVFPPPSYGGVRGSLC